MEEKRMTSEENATERLFCQDSHQKEFTATVLSCEAGNDGYRIVLDRTAFFPEGGGQSGDSGWLDGIRVLDTHEKDGIIYHTAEAPLEAGILAMGKLDYETRFERMQQHTGEHIVSGIVHSLYGYDNVGFHLGAEVTTLDFNGELTQEQVEELESRANGAVFANISLQTLYRTKEELKGMEYRSKIEIDGQIRIVSIPGYDICACCAPHVERTGEVGLIRILSCEKHRGGCRVTIVCGSRALADYRKKQQSVTEVSVALSAKPDKIGEAVLRLKEQQTELKERLSRLQASYLQQKLSEIAPDTRNLCLFEEEMDSIAARNFINEAVERCTGVCGIFIGTDAGGYHYILGSREADAQEAAKLLNSHFQGKGGGKPQMAQGSLVGTQEEIRKAAMAF